MSEDSSDILYAYAQLGVLNGATVQQANELLANARAYRFATRERIARVERLTRYLAERAKLGSPQDSFATIRKTYYRRAMELHPDSNEGDTAAEDQLKALNAAYELIEDIHAESRDYFAKSETERRAIDTEARAETGRETEAAAKNPRTVYQSYAEAEKRAAPQSEPPPEPTAKQAPPGTVKYMAAWVPRHIRNRRLFYLGHRTIIGSRLVKSEGSAGLLYDLIMLPEREFIRAKLNLGIESSGSPALEMSTLTPAYIPIHKKEVIVPPGEADPETFAKRHFHREYGLDE